MNWSDLSLTHKLRVPLLLVGGLLIALTALQITSLHKATNASNQIEGVYTPALDKALNADRDLYQARIAERTLAYGKQDAGLIESHSENLDQVDERLSAVQNMAVGAETRQLAGEFLAAFRQWRPKSEALVSGVTRGTLSVPAAIELTNGRLDSEFDAMRDLLDQVGETLSQSAATLHADNKAESASALRNLLIMTGLTAGILIAVIAFLPPVILGPIKRITNALDFLARGEGDLTRRLPVDGRDEIGKMASSFNAFLTGMQQLVSDIQTVTQDVSQTSDQLMRGADKSQQNTQQFVSELERVTHANREMEQAIDEISRSTTEVAEDAKNADGRVSDIAAQFRQAVGDIAALSNSVSDSAQVIRELEQETTGIVSLLEVIQGIAEQTNLLALNAAIEAARAGEQGRGFAVVADEVRTLAGKTQQATEDINNMIDKLQSGVQRAVSSMQGGEETAGRSVEAARESESHISEVSGALVRIKDRVLQVAAAIEEQTSVINDINQNLNEARTVSQRNEDSTRELVASATKLEHNATRMQTNVANFRV